MCAYEYMLERNIRVQSRFAKRNPSQVKLLLSYLPEPAVDAFYAFVERLVLEYGASADISVEEARSLCRSPAAVRESGQAVEDFLSFVAAVVERREYACVHNIIYCIHLCDIVHIYILTRTCAYACTFLDVVYVVVRLMFGCAFVFSALPPSHPLPFVLCWIWEFQIARV